ncbi:MAG: lipopolysaccharide heptosyltransferase II [Planctomycetota bacterium]|nr:MAG: lipopolysaccharide heptosyltransferase II [Planctomycetota bacterium]
MSRDAVDAASIGRLLVRLPNWVGDVVMATPTLDVLRAALPGAQIVLEGRAFMQDVLLGLESYDAFLPTPGKTLGESWRHGRALRREGFDAALLLTDSQRTALSPWIAGIPLRAGYARDLTRRLLLSQHRAPPQDAAGKRLPVPMVERYLDLLPLLGIERPAQAPATRLAVDDAARRAVAVRLMRSGVGASPYLLASPGAAFGASKLYPPPQLSAALDGISDACDLAVVLAPGPGEVNLCQEVIEGMQRPAALLHDPVTSLAEMAALLSASELLVGNDTGPRHMAVALGVPVVTLMGPTDPRHTAFQLERQRVLREDVDCSPCHKKICPSDHRCFTRLAPERVVAAAQELLDEVPTA